MKLIISILALSILLNASYLYKNRNKCAEDYWYDKSGTLYFVLSSNPSVIRQTTKKDQTFVSGYEYNSTTEICSKKQVLRQLQISNEQYYFLIALIGVFSGFTFLFFSIYIAVDVAKK